MYICDIVQHMGGVLMAHAWHVSCRNVVCGPSGVSLSNYMPDLYES